PWSFHEVIRKGEAVCVNALDDLPARATVDRASYEAWGTQSVLLIPLLVGGVVEYIISIASVECARIWPEEHIPRLRLLGETFANALMHKWAEQELARNREALHHLAGRLLSVQEEERRRLARELHDDLTQRLAILAIEIGKLEQQRSAPQAMVSTLREIRERTVDLSADVHDISRQLHPSIIEDLGLKHAIRSECANFTKREGVAIRYEPADLPRGIPMATSVCLFRIVQEALRNIGKHAKVKEAHVSLVGNGRQLTLVIKDSGVGFDMAGTAASPGLGLASMRERVRLIRGTLSIESAPGKGTEIQVVAPLPGTENDGQADNHSGR
ncbi:MAG: sensor histidine kinase, partial [Planctomycetota bacterium]